MERIKIPKTKKTPKIPKTPRAKTPKTPKTPKNKPDSGENKVNRVRAPERIKAAVKQIKKPSESEVKKQGETIRVLVDIHSDDQTAINPEWKGERFVEVEPDEKQDEAELKRIIEFMGNYSGKDSLWHYGSSFYNEETYQESRDRVRLYYESIHSYPSREYMERLGAKLGYHEGWMAGFIIGAAYGRDHIDEETIKQWEIDRAEKLRGKPFDEGDIKY